MKEVIKIPLPTPSPHEEKQHFLSRCIEFIMHEDKNMESKQASAIAYEQWRKGKKE